MQAKPQSAVGSSTLSKTESDGEYAALAKRLEKANGKTDSASVTERTTVLKQMAEILAARRTTDRFQCYLPVNLVLGAAKGTGVLTNIGSGGGFLKTSFVLSKFAALQIEVKQAGRLPMGLSLKGQVRWVKAKEGAGIAFQELGAAEQEAIKKLLGELVREQPPLT